MLDTKDAVKVLKSLQEDDMYILVSLSDESKGGSKLVTNFPAEGLADAFDMLATYIREGKWINSEHKS